MQQHHTSESERRTKRRRPGSQQQLLDADLREYLGLPPALQDRIVRKL